MGLAFRIYWMVAKTPVISNEGSEYVRMAENLANGKGLVGNFEGPATMYAPLFSVLTAGVSLLTKNAELAAHLISIVFGTALIIPVFFIALRMYGVRVAYLSAALVAFHPLLIALSGSIYNENVYIPLLLAGVYFGMRALESHKNRDYVLLSLCLSLAYLSRPEAFAYPLLFALALWVSVIVSRLPVRQAALGAALILVTFLLVASPYIGFLYVHTGHVRLEGKWGINYTIANRIRSGMNSAEAAGGLGPDSSVAGPLLDPFRFAAYTPYPHTVADKVETLWAMAKLNRQDVFRFLRDRAIGGPLVLVLALLGLFRKSWGPRRLFHESIIICTVMSILFLMLTASSAEFRYVLPLLAFGILWTTKGIDELGKWTRSLICSLKVPFLPAAQNMGLTVEVSLALLIFIVALRGTRSNGLFDTEQSTYAYVKQACLWLKDVGPGSKRIACVATIPTYYAKGTVVGLPYAESSQTLRYLDSRNVDFIVLDSHYVSNFPVLSDWIKHGIPDQRAQLIYEAGADVNNRVAIYRWEKPPGVH
jgi:4-amino-4-deoxy-L-arabinose transferase-like glycosyltransferase